MPCETITIQGPEQTVSLDATIDRFNLSEAGRELMSVSFRVVNRSNVRAKIFYQTRISIGGSCPVGNTEGTFIGEFSGDVTLPEGGTTTISGTVEVGGIPEGESQIVAVHPRIRDVQEA